MMPPFEAGRPWPIVANSRLAGLVVVPPQPPFTFLLTRYAPTLLSVAAVTLVVGGVLAALVIFGGLADRTTVGLTQHRPIDGLSDQTVSVLERAADEANRTYGRQ